MKKNLTVMSSLILITLTIAGCQSPIPKSVAGTWKPDKTKWIITIEPDGNISWMKHFVGMEFDVSKGGLKEPWRGGGEAIYSLGDCSAQYDKKTKQLTAKINIDNYVISFPNGSMEGSFSDVITGHVSDDGKTWNAKWTSKSEIIGNPVSKLPKPVDLVFTKISKEKIEKYKKISKEELEKYKNKDK